MTIKPSDMAKQCRQQLEQREQKRITFLNALESDLDAYLLETHHEIISKGYITVTIKQLSRYVWKKDNMPPYINDVIVEELSKKYKEWDIRTNQYNFSEILFYPPPEFLSELHGIQPVEKEDTVQDTVIEEVSNRSEILDL